MHKCIMRRPDGKQGYYTFEDMGNQGDTKCWWWIPSHLSIYLWNKQHFTFSNYLSQKTAIPDHLTPDIK